MAYIGYLAASMKPILKEFNLSDILRVSSGKIKLKDGAVLDVDDQTYSDILKNL